MAGNTQQLSIRDSVGAALRFVREDWRLVFSVAAAAALAQGLVLMLGANLIWFVVLITAMVVAHTAIVSGALGVPRPFWSRLGGDASRVGIALLLIGFALAILALMGAFVAMSVLIAPYSEQVKAAGEDQAAISAIVDRALTEQPHVMTTMMVITFVVVFLLTTRFYLAAPASIDRGRVTVFSSWKLTQGNFLRIAGARLLLLAPAFIFVSALQSLVALGLGAPAGDPFAMMAWARSNLGSFQVFYTVSLFLQISFFLSLEAGLSAHLYKALKPPAA